MNPQVITFNAFTASCASVSFTYTAWKKISSTTYEQLPSFITHGTLELSVLATDLSEVGLHEIVIRGTQQNG